MVMNSQKQTIIVNSVGSRDERTINRQSENIMSKLKVYVLFSNAVVSFFVDTVDGQTIHPDMAVVFTFLFLVMGVDVSDVVVVFSSCRFAAIALLLLLLLLFCYCRFFLLV
jgi:hypothetical protein